MMWRSIWIRICLIFLIPVLSVIPGSTKEIRLLVQITVDQLRGDMLPRFQNRFEEGGYLYLMNHGVNYTNARFQYTTTFTAVGHATLFTGANPAQHGLAANDWCDPITGDHVYCVEDREHQLLGVETKPHAGVSPRNLTSTTVGDELVMATGGRSRVFSVSIKDRGAILPGGFCGKAFWYHSSSGQFVSSSYYYKDYPEWVKTWNAAKPADRFLNQTWNLRKDPSTYLAEKDDRPFERGYKYLDRTFPHPMKTENPKDFYKSLPYTPFGDILTIEFAKKLIQEEKIGQGTYPDMLCVSLSVTDYVGHAWGVNSMEAEDNQLWVDATLADFLQFLDHEIGLDQTLIVLASDHGMDDIPEQKVMLGMKCGRLVGEELIKTANETLRAQFGIDEDLVSYFWNPGFFLNKELLKKYNLHETEVEQALAERIRQIPGVALAMTRSGLLKGQMPENELTELVKNTFHPTRSGNVYIIQEHSWYLYHTDDYAAMHGSPYSYDTHVPILFCGPEIQARKVSRLVAPRDIAPTIAVYMGIEQPSGCLGEPLYEVLGE